MQDEVANLLWEQSWQVYGESLSKVLSEAFASYKRSAGYDEMQRLYPSAVGDGFSSFETSANPAVAQGQW